MRALFLLALVALSATPLGERIYGDIYEWENLTKVQGAVVRIYANSSMLLQEVVSSPYSIALSPGAYRIEVSWRSRGGEELSAEENFTLPEGAEVRMDLLLLPGVEEIIGEVGEPRLLEEGFAPPSVPAPPPDITPFIIGALAVLVAILVLIYLFRRRGKPSRMEVEFNDKLKLLALAQEAGAVKQSELVARTGWSRAKVSMLLGELERERRITREKIGREKIVRVV